MKFLNSVLAVAALILMSSCKYPAKYVPFPETGGADIYGLEIIIPAATIYELETIQAQATVILASGKKMSLDAREVIWESMSPNIASVDSGGIITGLGTGRGEIRISMGGLTATGEIMVERKVYRAGILISEVFYDAAGGDEGKEFVEIYNDNENESDISGMQIVDGNSGSAAFVFPDGSMIGAKSYAVIAQTRDGFFDLFGTYPDYSGMTFTLNNSGETIMLLQQDGTMMESVYIKGGSEEYPAPGIWGSNSLPAAAAGSSVYRVTFNNTDTCLDWSSGPPSPGR